MPTSWEDPKLRATIATDLHETIARWRGATGNTESDLADATDIPHGTFNNWANGHNNLPVLGLVKLTRAMCDQGIIKAVARLCGGYFIADVARDAESLELNQIPRITCDVGALFKDMGAALDDHIITQDEADTLFGEIEDLRQTIAETEAAIRACAERGRTGRAGSMSEAEGM